MVLSKEIATAPLQEELKGATERILLAVADKKEISEGSKEEEADDYSEFLKNHAILMKSGLDSSGKVVGYQAISLLGDR